MIHHSVQRREKTFVRRYGFLSFTKSMSKSIGKNISNILCGKYCPAMLAARQNFLDYAKQSATDALKTALRRAIQKAAEVTGDLIGEKIADKITKVSKLSQQNSTERVANEAKNIRLDRKIPKERDIPPKKSQENIINLRLIS